MNSLDVVSNRTVVIEAVGALATAVIYALTESQVGGEAGARLTLDFGDLVVIAGSAAVVLGVAYTFWPGEPLRRQWTLIGLGVASFAMGDLVWTIIEDVQRRPVPYPGPADIFYVAEYFFLGVALLSAALAYGRVGGMRRAGVVAALVAVAAGTPITLFLLRDILTDSTLALGEKLLSTFYPLADVLLLLAPAILIVTVVGRGKMAWPWWLVAAAVVLIAVSDCAYSWLEQQDMYRSGHLVDYGWMLAHVMIATAASLAKDVA